MAAEITTDDRRPTTDDRVAITAEVPVPRWAAPARRGLVLGELAALLSWLREWQLWLVLALGLVAWSLAYQMPYSYELNFGGDRATQRRYDDEPFTSNWNIDPEPAGDAWLTSAQPPFRWALDEAGLDLPGLGRGQWRVQLLAAGQPTPWVTPSVWSDGTISSTVLLTEEPRVYQHVFTTNPDGDLTLHFSTPAFSTPTDPRPLGFVGFTAVVQSLGTQTAPPIQLIWLALSVGTAYGVARRLGLERRWVAVGGVCLAMLLALLLAYWRIPVTAFTHSMAPVALGCYPLALVLLRLPLFDDRQWTVDRNDIYFRPAVARRRAFTRFHPAPVVALVVLGFAIRLGGMLHPQIIFSDIGLNANNLLGFSNGHVYQTEGLPAEAGGGDSPYPTGLYILAAPLELLLEPTHESRLLILKLIVGLLDSMIVGLIWYVLRRRGYGQRAALFAAALYVVPSAAFKSFGVGEFANLAGQALALPLIAGLGLLGGRMRELRVFALMLALMLFAFLGHSGVTISVVLLLGYLGVSWMVGPRTYRFVIPLLGLGIAAAVLIGAFYHSAFLHLFVGAQRAADVAAALPDRSFGTKLMDEMRRVFGEPMKPVSPMLAALGALGIAAMAMRLRRPDLRPGLWPIIVAWWGSALLSLGLLIVRDQTVRWDLFLYPALCLAAGPLLATVWRRGRAGRIVALTLLAFLLARGLFYWVTLIANQYHV